MTKSCEISLKVEFDRNDHDQNDHKIKSGSPLLVHTRERYKEYDGCYLGHYAQLSFGFLHYWYFVVAGGLGMVVVQYFGK